MRRQPVSERIAVLTDSTCDLDPEVVAQWGIEVLPLKIIYPDRVYHDRIDIQPHEVYAKFPKEVPTTSTPSPQEAADVFRRLLAEGYTGVIALTISSGLSSTLNAVRVGAQEFQDKMKIAVIDSRALSQGLGLVVVQTARWIKEQQQSFEAIVEQVKAMVDRTKCHFVVASLEYLRRGGRIGLIAGTMADVLDIKPIISIDEKTGKYYTFKKVRGRRQSIDVLFEIAKAAVAAGRDQVAVVHADGLKEAQGLFERVRQLPGIKNLIFGEIGPAMVVHSGPGLVGVITTHA